MLDFVAGIIELLVGPWTDKMSKKWKTERSIDKS